MAAKLKPLSKPEDMAAVPTSEPILVLLEPPSTGAEAEPPDLKTATPVESTDDGAKQLQDQLEASQAAQKTERERREAAERATLEARRIADEARQETVALRSERDTSDRDLMAGSLQAAQAELAAAQTQFKGAYDAADGAAMADAQAKISRAAAKVLNFEGAVAEHETRKEREAAVPKRQETPAPLDPVAAINANPGLMPTERDWLIAHQDAYIDPARNNELGVAYHHATRKGLVRGTAAYFTFLNDFMGYEQPPQRAAADEDPGERSTSMSAPVSREHTSVNGQRSPNQVTLTPEERDMARSMGLTDVAYARQKLNLAADKKHNPERYGRQN